MWGDRGTSRTTRSTNGYLNVWTDGIWARAPYLHNGSVPTLWDLLQPVDKRPRRVQARLRHL